MAITESAPALLQETTCYVRTDGGSTIQCSGRVDAPYPGGGTNQPCAWDHPFRALPPMAAPQFGRPLDELAAGWATLCRLSVERAEEARDRIL